MVADEEKDGYIGGSQAADAAGELPLLGLAGLAGLVGVPAEEHQVGVVFQGVVNQLVENGEEILKTGRKAGGGVRPAVVLHAEVQVGKVNNLHLRFYSTSFLRHVKPGYLYRISRG